MFKCSSDTLPDWPIAANFRDTFHSSSPFLSRCVDIYKHH